MFRKHQNEVANKSPWFASICSVMVALKLNIAGVSGSGVTLMVAVVDLIEQAEAHVVVGASFFLRFFLLLSLTLGGWCSGSCEVEKTSERDNNLQV